MSRFRRAEVCGVIGISCTDFRIAAGGHPWIMEFNIIPGVTSHSLVPMSIRATEKLSRSFGNDCCFNVTLRADVGTYSARPSNDSLKAGYVTM